MIVYSKTKQLREIINLNRSKINHFANLIFSNHPIYPICMECTGICTL